MSLVRRLLAAALLLVMACGGDTGVSEEAVPTLEPAGIVEATPATYRKILESLEGGPLVVNYWATWCEPCKDEMPRLVEAANEYEGEVRFLGVNVEDGADAARAFVREMDIPFPNVADPRGEIRRAEEIVGLPTTQFYRADGELAFVHSGEIEGDELEERLAELVKIGAPPLTPDPPDPTP